MTWILVMALAPIGLGAWIVALEAGARALERRARLRRAAAEARERAAERRALDAGGWLAPKSGADLSDAGAMWYGVQRDAASPYRSPPTATHAACVPLVGSPKNTSR